MDKDQFVEFVQKQAKEYSDYYIKEDYNILAGIVAIAMYNTFQQQKDVCKFLRNGKI